MSERQMELEAVRGVVVCYGDDTQMGRLARTALAWLADRDALAERIGFLQVERDTVWNQADTFRAERDAVTVERDEAYRQRDEAFARADDGRHEVQRVYGSLRGRLASRLNVSISEPDEAILDAVDARAGMKRERDTERGIRLEREAVLAEVRAEVSRLQSDRDSERGLRLALESQIEDARAILGAAPDELLSDAARRAVSGPPMTVLNEVRAVLGVPPAESVVTKAKWIMEARAKSHEMQNEREAEIDRLRARVAELESAEAEPPQVFRVKAEVRITPALAEVRIIERITDPRFLALSGHQLARLGLVVCDG